MTEIDKGDTPRSIAETAFRRIARRKLRERGLSDEAAIEAKIDELLRKGLPIDPNVLTE